MNYTKHYHLLIQNARTNPFKGYTEKHHIVPRCLGGTNTRANIIRLSARQHFVAHWLLTKIYPNNHKIGHAFLMMFVQTGDRPDWRQKRGKQYEQAKILMSTNIKIRMNTNHPMIGHVWSDTSLEKMRSTKRANPRVWTDEDKKRWSELMKSKNRRQPESQKQKVAKALAKTWRVTFPDGHTETITNLRQFCIANHLNQGNLSSFGQTKGYRVDRIA